MLLYTSFSFLFWCLKSGTVYRIWLKDQFCCHQVVQSFNYRFIYKIWEEDYQVKKHLEDDNQQFTISICFYKAFKRKIVNCVFVLLVLVSAPAPRFDCVNRGKKTILCFFCCICLFSRNNVNSVMSPITSGMHHIPSVPTHTASGGVPGTAALIRVHVSGWHQPAALT